jgi:hypothetical protein
MPDYQLSKVYQIVCLTTGQKYVGSTTQKTLAERLAGHICNFKCWKKGNRNFMTSFTIIERGNYQIELLELYPCNSKDELNAREGHYIRTVECVNKNIMGRTVKEWITENKTKLAEYNKNFYIENKAEVLEKVKAWTEVNKVKKEEYMKAYREKNKTELAEKHKAYRLKKKVVSQ